MARSNAEIFLDHYKDLEYIIREKYKLENWESTIHYLTGKREFKKIVNELQYCREVRNLLSHKPKLNDRYSVEPSDEMIHLLKTVKERLEMPPVIMDVAVPVEKILYKTFDDAVIQVAGEYQRLLRFIALVDDQEEDLVGVVRSALRAEIIEYQQID